MIARGTVIQCWRIECEIGQVARARCSEAATPRQPALQAASRCGERLGSSFLLSRRVKEGVCECASVRRRRWDYSHSWAPGRRFLRHKFRLYVICRAVLFG